MSSRDRQALGDMLAAARKLRDYAEGTSRESLLTQPMRLDAVLYEIVVLGEAARRLSAELRGAHPEVPWREIIGMRSVVTHGYDQIDGDELMAGPGARLARIDVPTRNHLVAPMKRLRLCAIARQVGISPLQHWQPGKDHPAHCGPQGAEAWRPGTPRSDIKTLKRIFTAGTPPLTRQDTGRTKRA